MDANRLFLFDIIEILESYFNLLLQSTVIFFKGPFQIATQLSFALSVAASLCDRYFSSIMAESIGNCVGTNDGTTGMETTAGLTSQAESHNSFYMDMSESMGALMAQAMGQIESRLEDMLTGKVEKLLTNIAAERSAQNSHNTATVIEGPWPDHNVAYLAAGTTDDGKSLPVAITNHSGGQH